jgi:opacity protein-like surface antigen
MKRIIWLGLVLLGASASASAQYYFDYPKYERFEVCVFLSGWLPLQSGLTTYSDFWHDRLLLSVLEETAITVKPAVGPGAGASFAFYFNRTFGIQAILETSSSGLNTTAEATMAWTWADMRNVRQQALWTGTGRLAETPVSLDAVIKVKKPFWAWTVSGGPTAFRTSFTADSWFCFGVSKMSEDEQFQLVDGLKVGLTIPRTSWWALGLNLGLGAAFRLSDRLGLKIEARYYYCPEKIVSWSFVQGVYDGIFYGEILGEPFGEDSVAFVTKAGTLSALAIAPSSLRLGIGLAWTSTPVIEY